MQQEILTLSDELLEARRAKEQADQALKEKTATVGEIETKLIEAMVNSELDNFKRNGVQFILATKSNISAEPERKDDLWSAMKQQGYEHLFSINAQTLSGEIKRLIEENNDTLPEWLNGLVKQFDKPSIRVKK